MNGKKWANVAGKEFRFDHADHFEETGKYAIRTALGLKSWLKKLRSLLQVQSAFRILTDFRILRFVSTVCDTLAETSAAIYETGILHMQNASYKICLASVSF